MRHDAIIRGERVRLVPYQREHVPRYNSWMQDPELLRLTGSEPLSLEEELDNQVSWYEDATKVTFIICTRTDADEGDLTRGMVGDVNAFLSPLVDDDEDEPSTASSRQLSAEIEVMIAEPQQRRAGLAREALLLFFHWLLERVPSVARLVVKITDDNAPSLRLFRSLGFTLHKHMAVFEQTEMHLSAQAGREEAAAHWAAVCASESSLAALAAPSVELGPPPPPPPLALPTAPVAAVSAAEAVCSEEAGGRWGVQRVQCVQRVLVLSYEFTYSPFSGNGVLCRSLVKGLLAQGCKVVGTHACMYARWSASAAALSLPPYPPTRLPTYPRTYLLPYLPAYLRTYLLPYLPAYLPTCLLPYLLA